jgi:2-polyprenyl-3-methyl-5-hydroxy-6-metoxy-1,4-benzoquinol methylase
MESSIDLYSKFAKYYRQYSKKRQKYLDKIDQLILNSLPNDSVISLLDVGCGDGVRIKRLYDKSANNITQMTLVDNCPPMITLACKKLKDSKNVEIRLVDISDTQLTTKLRGKFEVICCLWNVLGHIETDNKRILALRNMKKMLTKDGKIFLDVNNRYNFLQYGFKNVLINIWKDVTDPKSENGDFSYKIKVMNNCEINAITHIFNKLEMARIIKKAELRILRLIPVNYNKGTIVSSTFFGQLFYILEK